MISRGKFRHLKKVVAGVVWKAMTPEQQKEKIDKCVYGSLRAVSIHYGVPLHILMGKSK